MSRRTRRREPGRARGGPLLLTLLLIALLIGSVFTVVMVLDALERPGPIESGCRISDGEHTLTLSAEQTGNAALIVAVGANRGLPERALTIAVATAMQESSLRNLDHGDRDSLGLFQQRPSQGWGSPEQVQDPVYAAGVFYDRLIEVPDYLDQPLTQAAQTVQRSAFPDLYAQHEGLATALTRALTGAAPAALWCHLPAADDVPQDRLGRLLARDHPEVIVSSVLGGRTRLDAGSRADSWALAQWTVATAGETGVSRVEVDGSVWERSGSGWEPLEASGDGALPEGAVAVR